MANNQVEISFNGENGQKGILASSPEDFAKFLKGLISPKDRMSKSILGSFSINKEEIINLYYMITQRVSAQNEGDLISADFTVLNSNELAYRFDSIDSFIEFAYISNKQIIFASMNLSFSLKNKADSSQEKHDISINFLAASSENIYDEIHSKLLSENIAAVRIEISYTSRTWAEDMMNLASNHLSESIEDMGPVRRFIRRANPFFAFSIATLSIPIVSKLNTEISIILSDSNSTRSSPIVLNETSQIASALSLQFTVHVFAFAIIAYLSHVAIRQLSKLPCSFIVMNEKNEKKRKNYLRNRRYILTGIAAPFAISVLAGVALNVALFL